MRTTIRLDDQLLREAKKVAADSGATLTQVIEDSLRESLARRRAPRPKEKATFLTTGDGGLRPGVDISNSAALLDLMEEADATTRP